MGQTDRASNNMPCKTNQPQNHPCNVYNTTPPLPIETAQEMSYLFYFIIIPPPTKASTHWGF